MPSCWSAGYGFFSKGAPVTVTKSESTEPNAAEASESSTAQVSAVEAAGSLICHGNFDAAGELIQHELDTSSSAVGAEQPREDSRVQLKQLAQIVQQYEDTSERRQSAREAAYQKQLNELDKLRATAREEDANNVSNISDANDVNDISKVLSVIAQASEFADETQRSELLSKPFVKQTFERTIDKAAEFELEGKWLDAYTNCYYWLLASDPDNEAYLDYAEQLVDKAAIVASFQDSPCETYQERYEGVKKDTFVQAIEALNYYYVNVIDYGQMASKAIRRCELLAEVMAVSFSESQEDNDSKSSFLRPNADQLTAWGAALAALSEDIRQSFAGFSKDKFLEVFEKVLALNITTVNLPPQVLIAHFSEAALSALDPYTVMVWPRQVEDFEKIMTNEFTGIGIEIGKPKGLLTVSSLLPDTPAYRAGLDAEDVIEAVDGVETKDMSLVCAVRKITGPKGTKVTLTIRRAGEDKTTDVTITRDRITVPTVRGWQRAEDGGWLYMIDQQNKVGYVHVTSFSGETVSDLEKVLIALEKEGLKGLILDLRFNTGGLFESAVGVTDKFLREGLIVKTQPGFGRIGAWEAASEKGTHPDYPLVVLINSSSASGSEIVAGALADEQHNRAVLVGQRTHGKGLVQGIMHFRSGGQLKYTMAYYQLPSGQRVKSQDAAKKAGTKDWGIGPDVEVKLTSEELKNMLDVQRDNSILVQANRDESRGSLNRHTTEETLAADPQLAVGVLIIKTKLVEAGAAVSNVY
jgi:carboxyl-terminal processing protease